MEKIMLIFALVFGMNTNNKINGYIYDKYSGEKLCGVKVFTESDTTYTDFNGCFELKNIADTANIRFELISYERKDTTIIKSNLLTINEK